MTRKERFKALEELCQQRYAIIDQCYKTIASAQKELEVLEVKYLKLQTTLNSDGTAISNKVRKLRKALEKLGLSESDISDILRKKE